MLYIKVGAIPTFFIAKILDGTCPEKFVGLQYDCHT
jgi:hypothetical protein